MLGWKGGGADGTDYKIPGEVNSGNREMAGASGAGKYGRAEAKRGAARPKENPEIYDQRESDGQREGLSMDAGKERILNQILDRLNYRIEKRPSDGVWVAWAEVAPEEKGEGASQEEALKNLRGPLMAALDKRTTVHATEPSPETVEVVPKVAVAERTEKSSWYIPASKRQRDEHIQQYGNRAARRALKRGKK